MERSRTYRVLALLLIICITLTTKAQTFKAAVDRDKILIGEQFRLILKAEGIRAGETFVVSWINMPDTFNHMEVVERSKIDTIDASGSIVFQQTITLTSFDSGQWQIPAIRLAIENKNSNRRTVIASLPITINVLPVDVAHLQDYHDIKEILEVENANSRWILIAIIAITVISIIAIVLLARRKRTVVVKPVEKRGSQTPIQWALSALDKLQKEDLPSKGQVKQYYLRLTDICRQYFHQQLHQKALHQTTDEWMVNLQSLPVEHDTKTAFFQFVRLADTVKFAKYLPPATEQEQSIKVSRQMLVQVAEWQQTKSVTSKPITS